MNKQKDVLVTGGAGFIGSNLTDRLLKEGYKVTVIDDLSEGKWENLPEHKNLIKIKASILDDLSEIIKNKHAIFHLAALPRLQRSIKNPLETHNVNVNGTLNLLLLARDNKVKKFIFSSSSSVYGDQKIMPLTENMTPNPIVPYSLHKLIGEEYCKLFANIWGLKTISLRYFNVYGPKMNPDGQYSNLIPKFIKILKDNNSPTINGDGTHSRDFTHVSDVVEANILALKSNLKGEVFNVGSGRSLSVNQVFKILNKSLGKNISPKYGHSVIEPIKTLSSNKKAYKLLKWKPKIKFEDGVKTML